MTTTVSTVMINQSGNINFTGSNVSLGNVANIKITGGSSGQVLTTDGTGNVSFANTSSGSSLSKSISINSFLGY